MKFVLCSQIFQFFLAFFLSAADNKFLAIRQRPPTLLENGYVLFKDWAAQESSYWRANGPPEKEPTPSWQALMNSNIF